MFRRRRVHQQPPYRTSSDASSVLPQSLNLRDEAEGSINLDHAFHNDDGAELVGQAKRIMDQATNQEIGGSEYENYMIHLARTILADPGRRLRFTEDDDTNANSIVTTEEKPASVAADFTQGLDEGERAGFSDGFFEESYGRSRGRSRHRNQQNEDDESIVTMNIDASEENEPEPNQLARTFHPTDFQWLCIGGAIPLTMICGMSNGISYCGPTGMLIGYALVTPGVLVVLSCISEMIAFHPMDGGFTLLVCEYIEAPLGLTIGLLYWFNCALTVPIELLQSIKLLLVFPYLDTQDRSDIVFLTFFLGILVIFSLTTTRSQSLAIRFASTISIACLFILCVIIWTLCIPSEYRDGLGLRFWHESDGFRPDQSSLGLGVNRWRQVGHACSLALRAYNGIDVVYTAMPEIRNARRTIKRGFHWLSARVLIVYLVLLLSFTFVTDPTMWDVLFSDDLTNRVICMVKPEWVQELMRDGIFCSFLTSLSRINRCRIFYLINAFVMFCGVFDAGIQLYGASRTLHGLGYSGVLWKRLSWCTRERVPLVAVIISTSIGTVAFASVGVKTDDIFTYLQLFVSHSYLVVWATVCWAYIRYFYALKLQEKRTRVSRKSDDYPFKSWFQPYSAICAIIWCIIMFAVTTTEQYYYNLSFGSTMWKGNFVATSLPVIFLLVVYFGSKWYMKSTLVPLNQIGIMAAKRKMDAEEWEEDRVYRHGMKERIVRWLA